MEKYKAVNLASIFGMLGNLFLLVMKAIVGFVTNSQSMIADAFNSAGDIFSSVMTFIGNKVASKVADDDHNLGHGKAEYIYSMLISVSMLVMTFKVLTSSIMSLFNKGNFTFSIWLIVVCLITIVVKFFLYIYTSRLYKKYNNLLLKSNSIDHRNDCFLTLLNLVACICGLYGIYFIDGVVGIFISCWILYSSINIFKESYDVLMDKAFGDDVKNKVLEIVKRHKEIEKVNHFNSTPVGYRYQISFTIFVDGSMSTYDSHFIANALEKEIDKEIDEVYLTVIHVNPIEKRAK